MSRLALWIPAALGVLEIVLIVATFSRLIDPGWPAFGAIGTLAGLGITAGCLAVTTRARPRRVVTFRVASAVAILSGLAYAGAWLSLLGRIFWSNDLPRIAVLVASDLALAAWFLVSAVTLRRPRPPGFLSVGAFLSVWAAIEARYLAGMLFPTPPVPVGSTSGIEGVAIGGLILSGFALLAFWGIAVSRWTFGTGR
jgi:hypothetical protein